MKNLLVSTAAILALTTGLSLAAVGPSFDGAPTLKVAQGNIIILARRGGDDNGGDDNDGDRGRGRGGDDNGGDNSGGRGDSTDDNSVDDNSPNDVSGSGRKKPRIKGGSGCDDPGDVAEHAACQ
jgi:hypothetical protein